MPIKQIFNEISQCIKDTAYGWRLPGMDKETRFFGTVYGSAGAAMGVAGTITGFFPAVILGAGMWGVTAFVFQQRGAQIRHALEAQNKPSAQP